jgi:thiamine monophosphate kinase
VGAEIYSTKIPLPHNVIAALSGDPDARSAAGMTDVLSGGDDYELCFTSSQNEVEGCYKIGKIIEQKLLMLDGKETKPKGFEHKPMV